MDFTEHKISQGGYRGGVLFPQNHHTLKHKPDHVSPLLKTHSWPPTTFKFKPRIFVLAYKALSESILLTFLTNLQLHGSSLASQSTPSWFLSQDLSTHLLPGTLCPALCAAPEPLRSLPKCHLSDRPALTIPSVAPTQYCFPYVTHHI